MDQQAEQNPILQAVGLKNELTIEVEERDSAIAHGSGTLRVFATPAMAAYMEQCAWQSVSPYIDEKKTTVGTLIHINHLKKTFLGESVFIKSELTRIENKKLSFRIEAYANDVLIGEALHERFIVDIEKFMSQ